jgi:hypothetical protein
VRRSWEVGAAVRVRLDDGTTQAGQVWAKGPAPGQVWVALDTGAFVLVVTATGGAWDGRTRVGRVAA